MTKLFVISHTHWDREWYQTFEQFRFRLVSLIDSLLDILKKYPEYIFHLDAQTCLIEDYLEIRNSKKEELYNYIKKGNILIGPWYLQNDFYLTSGESTIRNLLKGKRFCEEIGAYDKYGYAPDQFGNISQLPQILKNFNIDTFVFARGYSEYYLNNNGNIEKKQKPTEFIWEGSDGSKVYAIFMAYWYNNAQRFSKDPVKTDLLIESAIKQFKTTNVSPYILMMNGVDHLEPQDDLIPILQEARKRGHDIEQISFKKYLNVVKDYLKEKELFVHKGALNKGDDHELLRGCWSSRIYIKQQNVAAQCLIENVLEPLYSMLEISGLKGIYSTDYFNYLWKMLLLNHPHDNICGCSCDAAHKHMEDSYNRLFELSDSLIENAMLEASLHTSNGNEKEKDYKIIVVNTLEEKTSGVHEVIIEFKTDELVSSFDIYSLNGTEIPYIVISKSVKSKDIISPLNLPGIIQVDEYKILLQIEMLPYSFNTFIVKPNNKRAQTINFINNATDCKRISNEKISIYEDDGSLIFEDYEKKIRLDNFLIIEDSADLGDSYVYRKPKQPPICFNKPSKIYICENNEYRKILCAEFKCAIPLYYDFSIMCRSNDVCNTNIKVYFIIEKPNDIVKINYSFLNNSKDHRLRLKINSGCMGKVSFSNSAFDINFNNNEEVYINTESKTFCSASFARMGEEKGITVFHKGNHEYENTEDGYLAFTVLRATNSINRNAEYKEVGGKNWIVPDNQCLRKIEGKLAVKAFENKENFSQIEKIARKFLNQPVIRCYPCDYKKYLGGRAAVQDTRLEEYFYKKDKYKNAVISNEKSLITVGKGLSVSALKKAEDDNGIILRVVNYSKKEVPFVIECLNCKVSLTNAAEDYLSENLPVKIKPLKICTLRLSEI